MAESKGKGTLEFKKGEYLFRAGQRAQTIYIIQQGLVSLSFPQKNSEPETDKDKVPDLLRAVQPQIIGEEALSGSPVYTSSARALNDTVVLPVLATHVTAMLRSAPPMVKSLSTGMLEKQVLILKELINLKSDEAKIPCPADKITKMFSVIYHVANYTGTNKTPVRDAKASADVKLTWPSFRKYCQRVFAESPMRLEQAMWLLSSVGLVHNEMVKNEIEEDAPEELGFVHFKNLPAIIGFAEFFRKNYDPTDPDSIKGTAAAGHDLYLEILNEIDTWNENGKPTGMPIPEANPKAAPKKKAS